MTITNGSAAGNGVDATKSSSDVIESDTVACRIDGDGEVQFCSHHDDDVKAPASSVRRKSSFIGTMAKVARQQVRFDLQEEDDGPPVRRISELDGETFFTPRTALPKRKQALLLIEGARDDIKQHDLFSPYDSDRILNYFDGVISFVAVFLYEELGWQPLINFREDPKPVLLSLLCYFHIVIYWLQVHHFLKFSSNVMSLPQVWCVGIFSFGLVLYPISLSYWIETGENAIYYYINTGICFSVGVFICLTKIDASANSLFVLWTRGTPIISTVYYGIATILKVVVRWDKSDILLYIAPWCFACPLGAKFKPEKHNPLGDSMAGSNIFRRALRDLKRGNFLSPFSLGRTLDFFDAVVGLATVFIFIDVGSEVFEGDNVNALLASILCYTHILAYWLNVHHMLKFSPAKVSILQVWCVIFFGLGMVFYPLILSAWVEDGTADIYYIINLALCGFLVIFSFLTRIEPGRSRPLYRLWHKLVYMIALVWYIVAFALYKAGHGQLWMLILMPVVALFPLGGAKERTVAATKQMPKEDDDCDEFFDCVVDD